MAGTKRCRQRRRPPQPHRRRLQALPALLFILLFASGRAPRVEAAGRGSSRDPQQQVVVAPAGDKKMLLELLFKALAAESGGSSSPSRHQAPSSPSVGAERVVARRYTAITHGGGASFYPLAPVDQEGRLIASSSSVSSSRERVAGAGHMSRLFTSSRHSDVFPRDSNLKDKFLKHFTGPVTFSAECSKHFHRLYHNTRDCSTPAYYKRCARLLTRLAMSPLCTQP